MKRKPSASPLALVSILVFTALLLASQTSSLAHAAAPHARTLQWAGRSWRVRSWPGGPGPNNWCDAINCVWVDGNGALHLTIRNIGGQWYASEVSTEDFTNLGEHRFYVEGPIDSLDPNVVLGLFLYSDIVDSDIEELDVEFATWGNSDPLAHEGWYTTWYGNAVGAQTSFDVALNGSYTTHAIDWQSTRIDFESLHGFYAQPPDPSAIIAQWSATNPNVIPVPEDDMRIHMNLWLMQGLPPTDGQEVEIIIHDLDAPPETPKNVQASDGASSQGVTVRWNGAPTAALYRVYRATTQTGPKTLLGSVAATEFEDLTAAPDQSYTYWVTGVNSQGESRYSAWDAGWRAIPMTLDASLQSNGDVTLTWPHRSEACSYEVFRDTAPYFDPNASAPATSLTAPASSHRFSGDAGDPASNHYYLVRAIGCASHAPSPSNRMGEFDFALKPGS